MEEKRYINGKEVTSPIYFINNDPKTVTSEEIINNEVIPLVTSGKQELNEYNSYVDYEIISSDTANPYIHSPNAPYDIFFYLTRETAADPEVYRSFIKNAETRFRRSKEYKTYKSYLMSLGFTRSQSMGNIEQSDIVDIELHHNILNLFDDFILICEHCLNTVGKISTFDLIYLVTLEHQNNRIPCCFLDVTSHQMYTNDPDGFIPPNMTFGRWWELLSKYRYGITFEIAEKVNKYIDKYRNQIPISIQIMPQEQILSFAYYNEYGCYQEPIPMQIPQQQSNIFRLE